MQTIKVYDKGRVTLPVSYRKKNNLQKGDKLQVTHKNKTLTVRVDDRS